MRKSRHPQVDAFHAKDQSYQERKKLTTKKQCMVSIKKNDKIFISV